MHAKADMTDDARFLAQPKTFRPVMQWPKQIFTSH
jgi:hypothetical protein